MKGVVHKWLALMSDTREIHVTCLCPNLEFHKITLTHLEKVRNGELLLHVCVYLLFRPKLTSILTVEQKTGRGAIKKIKNSEIIIVADLSIFPSIVQLPLGLVCYDKL